MAEQNISGRKKLCIVVPSLTAGGAERASVTLAKHLQGKGWNVTVVTLGTQDTDIYQLPEGVSRRKLQNQDTHGSVIHKLVRNIKRIRQLSQVLQEEEAQVALSLTDSATVTLALTRILQTKTLIIGSERIHPRYFSSGKAWSLARIFAYALPATIVCQTSQIANWIRRNTFARNVVVVPNHITLPLANHKPVLEPNTVVNSNVNLILSVGRLCDQKNFAALLHAFQRATIGNKLWQLVIIGEGENRGTLQETIKQLGLEGRVHLPGRCGNISDWYERAQIFCLTSKYEGFPNVLLEAMAHGRPCVSFDCETGPSELIRSGHNGVLVEQGDIIALAEAIKQLMNSKKTRETLAKNAVQTSKEFQIDRIGSMWEAVLSGTTI